MITSRELITLLDEDKATLNLFGGDYFIKLIDKQEIIFGKIYKRTFNDKNNFFNYNHSTTLLTSYNNRSFFKYTIPNMIELKAFVNKYNVNNEEFRARFWSNVEYQEKILTYDYLGQIQTSHKNAYVCKLLMIRKEVLNG
jgi:hypothetical protein